MHQAAWEGRHPTLPRVCTVTPSVAGVSTPAAAADAVLAGFRWEDGHADIWRVFTDPNSLRAVVEGLTAPWTSAGVTHVVGIEARGFLLGGACAVQLRAGFIAVRKDGGLLPGPKVSTLAEPDYRGNRHRLRMQHRLGPGDRVLLIDDWAERGSQARAAADLIAQCGATLLGLSVIVDELSDDVRLTLPAVTALVHAAQLGDSS